MKSKPRASAVNGNNASNNSSSLKHVDRERDKRRRTTENNNVGKEFQTVNIFIDTIRNISSNSNSS